MSTELKHRYDFILLVDCQDGNPNGDPDMGNAPRQDPETYQGLISDVCLKRKIRDYVSTKYTISGKPAQGLDIFVLQGHTLESRQKMPFQALESLEKGGNKKSKAGVAEARQWMCENFYDVRTFGAVMSTTDFNCGQVRGAVQMSFARSLNPITISEHAITRVAFTKEEKAEAKIGSTEMGRKHTLAYGLYKSQGYVNPILANKVGFGEEDLEILWDALLNMWDQDHSAARGNMATRKLIIFKHDSKMGDAPSHKLFERVSIRLKDDSKPPRSFGDYEVSVNEEGLSEFISVDVRG